MGFLEMVDESPCIVLSKGEEGGRGGQGLKVVDINEKKEEEDVDISSKDRGIEVQRGSGYK